MGFAGQAASGHEVYDNCEAVSENARDIDARGSSTDWHLGCPAVPDLPGEEHAGGPDASPDVGFAEHRDGSTGGMTVGDHIEMWLKTRQLSVRAAARRCGLKPWRIWAMKRNTNCRMDAIIGLMVGMRLSDRELNDFLADFKKGRQEYNSENGQMYLF